MSKNKKRKNTIPQAVRVAVWNRYVGVKKGQTHCFINCGNIISQYNFECGHIEAEASGGSTTIENLRPICGNCNKSIGTKNMLDFIKQYGFKKHKNWDVDKINEDKCIIL